jgi:hypothetical protein
MRPRLTMEVSSSKTDDITFGGGVDSGVEQHLGSRDNSPPSVSDRVTAYFYREIFSGSYTIGT